MTSTSTPTPHTNVYPQLKQGADGTVVLMKDATKGTVVVAVGPSLPVGFYQETWSGLDFYVGQVNMVQPY